jgi:hypothetical protein
VTFIIAVIDNLNAIGTHDYGDVLAAPAFDVDIPRTHCEAINLVVTDECPIAFLNDGAIGLTNEHFVALPHFVTLLTQLIHAGGGRLTFWRNELLFADRLSGRRHHSRIGARRCALDGRSRW